jgi:hypothetical protein
MQECVGFQELDIGVGPNPRIERAMVIEVFGSDHRPVPQTEITNIRNVRGLSCGASINISFAIATDSVELTVLAISGPIEVSAYASDGSALTSNVVRDPRRRPQTIHLDAPQISWVVMTTAGDTLLVETCFELPQRPGAHPAQDAYSTQDQRDRWIEALRDESDAPPQLVFHEIGHVMGLAGLFRLDDDGPAAVIDWLMAHAELLGIGSEDRVSGIGEEAFYELDLEHFFRARELAETKADDAGDTLAEALTERRTGTIYSFEVLHDAYGFGGMHIAGIVSTREPILRGVHNGFSPAVAGYGPVLASPEDAAWQAMEQTLGTALTRLESIQCWFDLSWALKRVPTTKELHWRLKGVDAFGITRYGFVRCADNAVVYTTPPDSHFAVRQTHTNDNGFVLWDNQTLPGGCSPGAGGCTGRAYLDSIRSRSVLPDTVDLWYRMSDTGPPPFAWPFPGIRLDNRGRAITAVLAHDGSVVTLPTRVNGAYYFPLDIGTWELDPSSGGLRRPSTVSEDVFGHEYGHTILGQLKLMDAGRDVGKTEPATFTEAMADFMGIVTENLLREEKYQAMTDFQILGTRWSQSGAFVDYAPVSWPLRTGNCAGRGRERLGHAFYKAWQWDASFYGDRPHSVRRATFRAWWIDIMRSFALVPDFPTISDFYAATTSRYSSYALQEFGVANRLRYEMELLGLNQGCY